MKKIVNNRFLYLALTVLVLGWVNLAFNVATVVDGGKPWNVPETAKKMKNPTS
jgi:hypothetical protein